MLKKVILPLLALSIHSVVNAGMYSAPPAPTCVPGDVTVPCETKKWSLGIQALYLKPTYNAELAYAPSLSTTVFQEVDPGFDWGYRLEGSYQFNTGNDVSINWSHYDVDDGLHGPYAGRYLQLGVGNVLANYQLDLENRYDQVNLVFGQHVDLGLVKNARFYGGLQYANMRVDETSYYTVPRAFLALTGGSAKNLNNTDFNGVGPVLGIDYAYDLSQRLSITANTAGSVLYGTSRLNFATAYGSALVASSVYGSRKIIVPSLEAKLGANYAYAMSNGTLNLEGGYQVVNYFSALQSRSLTGVLSTSDFGLYGPYFGIKWLGMA